MKFSHSLLASAFLALPMLAHASAAGPSNGGGGDGCEREFKALARDAADWLRENRAYLEPALAAKADPDAMYAEIMKRGIDCRSQTLEVDGHAKTGHTLENDLVIKVDLDRWDNLTDVGREAMVLHEGGVIVGFEATGYYPVSTLMTSDNKARWAGTFRPSDQPGSEFRITLAYQLPKEIESEKPVGVFPVAFPFRYSLRITDRRGALLFYKDGNAKYITTDYSLPTPATQGPIAIEPELELVETNVLLGDRPYYLDFRAFTGSGVTIRDNHYVLLRPEAGPGAIKPDSGKNVVPYIGNSGSNTASGYINVAEYDLDANPYTGAGRGLGNLSLEALTVAPLNYASVVGQISYGTADCGGEGDARFLVNFNDTEIPSHSRVFIKYAFRKNPVYGHWASNEDPSEQASSLNGSWQDVQEEEMFATSRGSEWSVTLENNPSSIYELGAPPLLSLEYSDLEFVFRIVTPDGKERYENGNFSSYGRYRADLRPFEQKCEEGLWSFKPLTLRSLVIN